MNPSIGVISMFYARPFLAEHFGLFARMKRADMDFVELLVPEPGELDLPTTRAALRDAGLQVVLAVAMAEVPVVMVAMAESAGAA